MAFPWEEAMVGRRRASGQRGHASIGGGGGRDGHHPPDDYNPFPFYIGGSYLLDATTVRTTVSFSAQAGRQSAARYSSGVSIANQGGAHWRHAKACSPGELAVSAALCLFLLLPRRRRPEERCLAMLPGMSKLLLQLQAAAASAYRRNGTRRRRPLSPLPSRHAPAAGAGRFGPCLVAFFLALAAAAILTLGLALHRPDPDADAPTSPRGAGGGYSVVINTWKRYDLLKRAVVHYSGCAGVDAVHVVWSEPRDPPEALRRSVLNCSRLLRDGGAAEVRFVVHKRDSLNNRFRPIDGLRTDAVFSVDDDLIVPCSTLRFAFAVWRSAPSAMVGFVPRIHWLAHPISNTKEYRYASWWSVWRTGTYSMVLSKASFLHKKYLDLYTNQMLPSIRDYVTENRNCEDIAMSFLVANVTGAPPVWVQGRIFEIGSTGISSSKGHTLRRSTCLNEFASMYGHMPLVATTVKAVDSRRSWFW